MVFWCLVSENRIVHSKLVVERQIGRGGRWMKDTKGPVYHIGFSSVMLGFLKFSPVIQNEWIILEPYPSPDGVHVKRGI